MLNDLNTQQAEKQARLAGILYLIIIILAGFSEGYVRSSLIVTGDPLATVENITGSTGLLRIGMASDLIAFICDALVAVLFYYLLKPVNRTVAMIAMMLRLVAHPAIGSLNLVTHLVALNLVNGAGYLSAFSPEQINATVLTLFETHRYGYLIAGAFFGVHLLFLGYLLSRSELFPSLFGLVLLLAGMGYLIESFGNFLVPGHRELYGWIVAVPAVAGELTFSLWLIVKGIRNRLGLATT